MNTWILAAAVVAVAATSAQAAPAKSHHRKHHHAPAVAYPDSVTLDGKEYKVCHGAIQDDCVQPRQAGLGFGNRPTDTYHPDKDQHP